MSDTIVITHLDGDDWHWYFVNENLASEGHSSLNSTTLNNILALVVPEKTIEYQYAFLDADLAEMACMRVKTLDEIVEMGFDPAEFE